MLQLCTAEWLLSSCLPIDRRGDLEKGNKSSTGYIEAHSIIIMTANGTTLSLSDYRNLRRPTISSLSFFVVLADGFLFRRTGPGVYISSSLIVVDVVSSSQKKFPKCCSYTSAVSNYLLSDHHRLLGYLFTLFTTILRVSMICVYQITTKE